MNHVTPTGRALSQAAMRPGEADNPHVALHMSFDDNGLLPLLYGEHDRNLARIENRLGVRLSSRGNRIVVTGPRDEAEAARAALDGLYRKLREAKGRATALTGPEVDAAARMARHTTRPDAGPPARRPSHEEPRLPLSDIPSIRTRKGVIAARTPAQAAYMELLAQHELVFALGPAGTGKTYLAVAQAVAMLATGRVERIVLSRPAVEAGERLGFLPGDLRDKVDPYLRPLYDALHDMMPADQIERRLGNGEIEVAPLAFMRGRTLGNCYAILDEAQNTTAVQMKMFLTRMGDGARMVVTGDPTQVDLPAGTRSGLDDAMAKLEGIEGLGVARFSDKDVVRHPMVARVVAAYAKHGDARG